MTTEVVACILHEAAVPCALCARDDEAYLRFLRGQSRIAALLLERVQAAQTAVGVLARYVAVETENGDEWEIGAAELADAATEAEAAAVALRRVRRIAVQFGVKASDELAQMERPSPAELMVAGTEIKRLRARNEELERRLAGHCAICSQRIDDDDDFDLAPGSSKPCHSPASHGYCGYNPPSVRCDNPDHHNHLGDVADPIDGQGSDLD